MNAGLQAVADYIVNMAVTTFNDQFGYNFNPKEFTILSLPANVMGKCAYEISNPNADDDVKLHIYATLTERAVIYPFRLSDDQSYPTGPSEKVYVALAEFNDDILRLNNNFIRRECPVFKYTDLELNTLLQEIDGTAILDEQYEYFHFEDSAVLVP